MLYNSQSEIGATASDLDNDGYLDLIFTDSTSPLSNTFIFYNKGTTYNYTTVSPLPGIDTHENSNWVWGDCDNDGVCNFYE